MYNILILSNIPRYPADKDSYGKSAWTILHSRAASLPEYPSRIEKIKFRHFLSDILRYFPCKDCAEHGREYLRKNRPNMRTRKDLEHYLCEFHNDVRKRQGKDIVDCKTVVEQKRDEKKECDTCSITRQSTLNKETDKSTNRQAETNTDTNTNEHDQTPIVSHSKLKSSLADYKNVTLKLVEELSRQNGINPTPTIIFNNCPGKRDTSCTHLAVDNESGKTVDNVNPIIYLDPNSYSPRTIAHEIEHIVAAQKGKEHWHSAVNEQQVDDIARDIIAKEFPLDTSDTHNSMKTKVVYDSPPTRDQRVASRLDSWKSRMPSYARSAKKSSDYVSPAAPDNSPLTYAQNAIKSALPTVGLGLTPSGITPTVSLPADHPPVIENQPDVPGGSQFSAGVMSLFDPVYRPIADLLGVTAADVNNAHTPAIVSNVITTTAESNLNSFGSVGVSLLSAAAAFAVGILAKDQMGLADRRMVSEFGANMLWSTLQYVGNPVYRNDVINNAHRFGHAIATMDLPTFTASVGQADVTDNGHLGQTSVQGKTHLPTLPTPDSLLPNKWGERGDPNRGMSAPGQGAMNRPLSPFAPERNYNNPLSTNITGTNVGSYSNRPGTPLGGRSVEVHRGDSTGGGGGRQGGPGSEGLAVDDFDSDMYNLGDELGGEGDDDGSMSSLRRRQQQQQSYYGRNLNISM